jgi:hypothetical protein
VARGWHDARTLDTDTDLASLWPMERFHELRRRMAASV